ncbi:MAG TPA: hypothetical protein VGP99_10790 [Tepidisphaeraceae bacterium]|jgi:hypothetical protein|nr:hypothetical protein [Tepidisphaeraceae bacterium]
MAIHSFVRKSGRGKKGMDAMYDMMGPGHVDHFVRQSIQQLWMVLPEGRRTVDEVEKQFRRIVDRALKDLREDATAFGKLR